MKWKKSSLTWFFPTLQIWYFVSALMMQRLERTQDFITMSTVSLWQKLKKHQKVWMSEKWRFYAVGKCEISSDCLEGKKTNNLKLMKTISDSNMPMLCPLPLPCVRSPDEKHAGERSNNNARALFLYVSFLDQIPGVRHNRAEPPGFSSAKA